MNGNTITVEELKDYCQQLCDEGKGKNEAMIAVVGVGSCNAADPYNDKLEWWDVTHIGYNGALRILASDVYYDKIIDKEVVKEMTKGIAIALQDLRAGAIGSLEENIDMVQESIDELLAEVS